MVEDDGLYPDIFAEKTRSHPKKPGKPFRFKGREFLRPVYREFHPTVKEKVLIYFGSRKIEKTEFILNLILYTATGGFVSWNTLYTIARRRQVRDFSVERLIPAIKTSVGGCLAERFIKHPTGVHNRAFSIPGQEIHNNVALESSWNLAEGVLGKEAQMVISDETQSQQKGFFAMLNEMMTQSEWKWFVVTGTARDENNELAVLWRQSTQNLWVVQCQHCGKDQIFKRKKDDGRVDYKAMGIENLFKIIYCGDVLDKEGNVIETGCGKRHLLQGWGTAEPVVCDCGKVYHKEQYTKLYKGCAFCKQVINPVNGKWKEHNHGAIYIGYFANQLMHPLISARKIYEKLISPGYPRSLFMNEVLGEFFGGEGAAIPIEAILACRRVSLDYLVQSDGDNNVMGVDTGKPNYVTIINMNDRRILYQDSQEFSNTSERRAYFIKLIDLFNVKQTVIDFGDTGRDLAKDLQEEFGDRVKTCRYTTRPGNWFQYKKKDGLGNKIFRMEVDRTTACGEVIRKFHSHSYKIPFGKISEDRAEETFHHYMNIIWEQPERGAAIKPLAGIPSIKIGNAGPDHYFHTIVYCELAEKKETKKVQMMIVGDKPKTRRSGGKAFDDLSEATKKTTGAFLR